MDAFFSMWLREIKKFFRNRSKIATSLVQPLIYLLILGYGLNDIFHAAGQGSYVDFLAPGIVAMAIIFGAFIGGLSLLWDRKFGFLKETLVSPSSRLSIIFGRAFGAATTSTVQGLMILLIAAFFGFHFDHWTSLPLAVIFMLEIGLMFSSAGIIFGSLIEDFQSIQLVTTFFLMPLYFLSGALFPLKESGRGGVLYLIGVVNPLSYGVDGARGLLLGQSRFDMMLNLLVVSATVVFLMTLSAVSFSRTKV